MKTQLIGLLLIGALAGCQTFDKAIATGYGLNIVTRDLSTELLDADKLSSAEGEKIKNVNDEVSTGLWKAWQIRKTYPDSAKAEVKHHLSAVKEIFKYLKDREVK
jgi:hypothetical protein